MMKTKMALILLLCLCAGSLAADWEADGLILWFDQGMGYGGPDRAGFLLSEGAFLQHNDSRLSLAAALNLDWRLVDGLALPLQVGPGLLLDHTDYYYHYLYAMAGWDFVTGRFCAQAHWRVIGPLSAFATLGWDRGLRLLGGVSLGALLASS